MPPKEARLVLAHTESWSLVGNRSTSRDPAIYAPAFLLEEQPDSIVILRGLERKILKRSHRNEPLYRPFSLDPTELKLGGHLARFDYLFTFVCAISWPLAEMEPMHKPSGAGSQRPNGGTTLTLARTSQPRSRIRGCFFARCISDHLRDRLQDAANWQDSLRRMKALLDDFPDLKTDERTGLLEDLAATVNAKAATAGSTETLLLDWSRGRVKEGTWFVP